MLGLLEEQRLKYKPSLPRVLEDPSSTSFKPVLISKKLDPHVEKLFPLSKDFHSYRLSGGKGSNQKNKIGVVFSGGPAPGGHNVIAGLFDSGADLIGFLNGPSGIIQNKFKEIKDVSMYRNRGGFDLIGTGRTKIETKEQLAQSLKTVTEHQLDGLVVIGGDDSNTNAALLAEYFLQKGAKTCVVGVPKTIDGDLRSPDIEMSFGFDSASKTYAELIGNIQKDALSALKYYHFIRLMGRSASHITLECALKTQPNLAFISEEHLSFDQIIQKIVEVVVNRYKERKKHGVILIPEGLIESLQEFDSLIGHLSVQKDPHGNIELSKIESEKIIVGKVQERLKEIAFEGPFNPICHSFGYEGRACLPSNFDSTYCYSLGLSASLAVRDKISGGICCIQNLAGPTEDWEIKIVPIVSLIHVEKRLTIEKPVIKKTLVDTKGTHFLEFKRLSKSWETSDQYIHPGPIQFFGPRELKDSIPIILE